MRENEPRGIGRCFSFSPAPLPLLLQDSDGVGDQERHLDGVDEQEHQVQHELCQLRLVEIVVQWG